MGRSAIATRLSLLICTITLASGCAGKDVGDEGSETGDATSMGDGDGDGDATSMGDGDGDGDVTSTGDSDTTGDGVGECEACLTASCGAQLSECQEDAVCNCVLSCVFAGQDEGICVQECGLEDPPGLYHNLLACMSAECVDVCW